MLSRLFFTILVASLMNSTILGQKLDVAGKITIGNDSDPATAGMLRYNTSTQDFEGYDGHQWWSLTGKMVDPDCLFNPTEESINSLDPLVYNALDGTNLMQIELYDPATGSFTLGENYATCNNCVLMVTDYNPGDGTYDKLLLAREGTLDISSITTNFSGSINNAILEEVTIDPSTFVSTPVPGGLEICINNFLFNTPIGSTSQSPKRDIMLKNQVMVLKQAK